MPRLFLLLMLVPLLAARGQESPGTHASRVVMALDSNQMRRHLMTLAHDSMEGRAPGTRGGRAAAEYIARRFREWNLEPAGDSGSYFHHFAFSVVRNVGASVKFGRDSLRYGIEQVGTTIGGSEREGTRGEAVFLGYGISSPRWDDYQGRDLGGKIAIVLAGLPSSGRTEDFPTGADSRTYKTTEAAKHGAAATLVIHRQNLVGFPWREIPQYWSEGHVFEEGSPGIIPSHRGAASFWVAEEAAERFLKGSGYTLDQLTQIANSPVRGPVNLGLTLDLAVRNEVRRVSARNVVSVLRGGVGADEFVVIGGHYDHLGIGPPINGDSIYNGAEDNAGGTAQLLTLAEAFAKSGVKPRRSILFIGFDGEEIGLLGSEAFVRRPTVPLANQVAMINLDAANLHGATRDVAALGLRESSLDSVFRRAAREEGLIVPPSQPDSIEAFFLRSDQLPFARAGVPAIFMFVGWDFIGRTPAWALEQWNQYFAERYHQPADEWLPWFSMAGALQQARVAARVALDLAQALDRPEWRKGSRFFR